MAEPTELISFDFKEVATALVKQQGLHEGRWMVAIELALMGGIMGPTQTEAKPSALVQMLRVQLVRQPADAPHSHLIVDAAEVNPG